MTTIPAYFEFYTWEQFTPVFALVGIAILILMADTFLPRFPKCVYPIVGGLSAAVTACFLYDIEHGAGFGFIICVATALSLFLAYDYRKVMCESIAGGDSPEGTGEFNSLCLIACAGACGLSHARDLITLFVCLETLTISSYALAGYFRRNKGSIEAGAKYLILGAMSTGILVFGAAWYFGMTGTFVLRSDCYAWALSGAACTGFLMALAFLLSGAFFKVGAAPLHVWIPDVYQGSPTPASAFLAAASKTAGFVVLCLLLLPLMSVAHLVPETWEIVMFALAIVTAATLLIGNLGAIGQNNVKRLLGYSSVGQAGFILVFFVCGKNVVPYTAQYLLAYTLATVPAFYAVALVRSQRGSEEVSAFRGLGKTNPRLAFLITVLFASLAGVPLTLGFIAKFKSFLAFLYCFSITGSLAWLMVIMIICAAAGFYYYFKVLRAMYLDKPHEDDKPLCVPGITLAVLSLSVVALIALGTWPLLTGGLF